MPARAELPVILDNFGAPVRFQGANIPGAPYNNAYGGQTLQIDQFDDRAILHWESFNVSSNNEVLFNQPRPSSIALNRVLGNTNAASIINGRITANGRVYIINHDGVVFGKDSVVNTRSLVASTLDVDDDVFLNIGIENAIRQENGQLPAFRNNPDFVRPMGEIILEKGSTISVEENGRVMVFAPKITNEGDITAEQGQIILAATQDEVYLAPADSDQSDIRGLLVGIKTGGEVSNLGSLIAERGNISLMGLAVNQEGLARATTSVSLNGSIVLRAQDNQKTSVDSEGNSSFEFTRGGELILAEGSITEVLPDDNGETEVDSFEQEVSYIDLMAEKITLKSGAKVVATGGDI